MTTYIKTDCICLCQKATGHLLKRHDKQYNNLTFLAALRKKTTPPFRIGPYLERFIPMAFIPGFRQRLHFPTVATEQSMNSPDEKRVHDFFEETATSHCPLFKRLIIQKKKKRTPI